MKVTTIQLLDGKIYYVFHFKGNAEADQLIDILKNCSCAIGFSGNLIDNNELINTLNRRRKPGSTLNIDAPVISVLCEDEMEKLIEMLKAVLYRASGIISESRGNAEALRRFCSDFELDEDDRG